jgi:hypothetical protein
MNRVRLHVLSQRETFLEGSKASLISEYVGHGMVLNWSGDMTSTSWPRDTSLSLTVPTTRTTPFGCGYQASVAIAIRTFLLSWLM